jgi:hypothetical protein
MQAVELHLPLSPTLMADLTRLAEVSHCTPEASALMLLKEAIYERMEDEAWDRIANDRIAKEGHLPRVSHEDAWK